jgi:hypothetical protein
MKVFILTGQVEYEGYGIYGVYPSLESAKVGAEPFIKLLGGRGPCNGDFYKNNPRPCEWYWEDFLSAWQMNVKKRGYDLSITEHEVFTEARGFTEQANAKLDELDAEWNHEDRIINPDHEHG